MVTTSPLGNLDARSSEDLPRVLVVDDVEANLLSIAAVLEELDCTVVRARSGEEALRQLLEGHFAVMVLDVQMPGMDGYEVAEYVRRNPTTRRVPIIFVTATHATPESEQRGYDTGAVDFLFKPVSPNILRGKVQAFIEFDRARQELARVNDVLARRNSELFELAESRAVLTEQLRMMNDGLRSKNEELRAAQCQLVQSEKMASLGKLVAGVAHEINHPLALVASHIDTVRRILVELRDFAGEPRQEVAHRRWQRAEERLEGMSSGLQRIEGLVNELRTFCRLDEGERREIRVSESVEAVLTLLRHRCRDRIQIATRCDHSDLIECYPVLFNQALLNLVTNAIDAIEESGRPGSLTVTTGWEGDAYRIRVSDTGDGIPEGVRERVVEPFFTTKAARRGTGLGLTIADSIIRKHGGTLRFEDITDGGTEAVVTLPRERSLAVSHGQ